MANAAISLPFSFNEYGETNSTSDVKKIWRDRVLLVIMTRFGERVMRPNFGSLVQHVVFEPEGLAVETAKSTITEAFSVWLSQLELRRVDPLFDQTTGALTITVEYKLPNGQIDETTVTSAILNRSGDIVTEIYNG